MISTTPLRTLRRWTRSAIAAGVVLLAACDAIPSDPILGEPTIVGFITHVDPSGAQLRVLVEENADIHGASLPGGDKIWFAVGANVVFDARGTTVTRARKEDLRVGLFVEALADGPLAESYPAQGHAETIVILD